MRVLLLSFSFVLAFQAGLPKGDEEQGDGDDDEEEEAAGFLDRHVVKHKVSRERQPMRRASQQYDSIFAAHTRRDERGTAVKVSFDK